MSTNSQINCEIERLAQICRKEETNLLIGKYELSLNQSVIHVISNEYKLNNSNNTTNTTNNSNNNNISVNNIDIKLNYLRQLFPKIPSIKVIGSQCLSDSVVYLNPFSSCTCLQLIRIPFKRLVGLDTIRVQLKSLNCFKCFETQVLDEEFWHWFGLWPQLTSLRLSQNNIISVKASIIPSSVQNLDLSWNRIKIFNNIADYSLNCISKLDLSYNCLIEVPKLNDSTCAALKSLFIRGNLIENIGGIEKLPKLIELDVAINCLIDFDSFVSSLKRCQSLRRLWIDGNPLACHRNALEIIQKELSFLTQLNGTDIHREQTTVGSFGKTNILSERQLFKPNSDEESEDQYFDASCGSMDSSIAKSDLKNGLNKKKKLRVVKIRDQIEVNEKLEKLEIKSNENSVKVLDNKSEAKELIQKRRDLGDEWLVSMRASLESNSYLSQNLANDSDTSSAVKDLKSGDLPIAESTPKTDRKFSIESTLTNEDDIEILAEENSEWSRSELENDTNIIIVENPDTNETLFIYVREEDGIIFEKDCVSGKVFRTHDLKVLTNVEIINDLLLKICFDSQINSKREVKYLFDSVETCLGFNHKFIIPWISRRKQKLISEEVLYECLKCGQNRLSAYPLNCCPVCQSDAIMKSDDNRKRRSGSDITILSQMAAQNQSELKSNSVEQEINVWEELFSINSRYDRSFFTRVEHSLKLYIEVKLFTSASDAEEVIEGLVKCKAMSGQQNRLESAFLVITNKNIMILTINENENYDNFDAYLKINISKPISTLIQMKEFPNLLTNQGFWLEFREEDNKTDMKSRSKSLINRFGSKRSRFSESSSLYCLLVFYDEIIGKSFIQYFTESVDQLMKSPISNRINQRIRIEENSIAISDELIVINVIKSANYKRNDMKSELKLYENIAVIVSEELIILGELCFDANNDYNIKVLYKELIINLMPQISVNLQTKSFKLSFSDDNIETHFTVYLYTSDSIKKILIPVKSQWEKAFDVPMPLIMS